MILFAPPPKRTKTTEETTTATSPQPISTTTATTTQLSSTNVDPFAMGFKALGVSDWLCETCKTLGIKRPTPVQKACIPALLSGKDVVGEAPTGSGKTAAFAIPVLDVLSHDPFGVFALIITPTRELATQIADQFRAFGSKISVRVLLLIGGVDTVEQTSELSRRPHIVVATPGRLADALKSIKLTQTTSDVFSNLRFLIFDEADRLLDPKSSFSSPFKIRILPFLPKTNIQRALFTATAAPLLSRIGSNIHQALSLPISSDAFVFSENKSETTTTTSNEVGDETKSTTTTTSSLSTTNNPTNTAIMTTKAKFSTVERCAQKYVFTPENEKECQLIYSLRRLVDNEGEKSQAIIFTSSCRKTELIHQMLFTLGFKSVSLHSQLTQQQRTVSLDTFRSGMALILVSTDVASRGLDIPSVRLVINYDVPVCADDYVHRVGRTARAGKPGTALTLITPNDVNLLHTIEKGIGKQLEAFEPKTDDVLFHLSETATAKEVAQVFLEETHFGEHIAQLRELGTAHKLKLQSQQPEKQLKRNFHP